MRLVITSALTFSKQVWKFHNEVVHGRTEEFKQSKALQIIHQKVQSLYQQYQVDPFILSHTRAYLFNKPVDAILSMDKEAIASWICSVNEGIYTKEHRESLEQKHLNRTLLRFLKQPTTSARRPPQHRKASSIWAAPFLLTYYRATAVTKDPKRKMIKTTKHYGPPSMKRSLVPQSVSKSWSN
jgi:hypothetical protein